MEKNLVEFYGELKNETDAACLVSDGVNEFWLPKSQIREQRQVKGDDCEFVVTEWIAKKKGIV